MSERKIGDFKAGSWRSEHDGQRSRRAPAIILGPNTDPPTAASTRKPSLGGYNVFDQARIMDLCAKGLIDACPPLDYPNDDLLIATVIDLGMPRWSAEQMTGHPGLRFNYLRVFLDVKAAVRGDKEALERIDVIRATFVQMRKDELVSDRPDMSIGMWER